MPPRPVLAPPVSTLTETASPVTPPGDMPPASGVAAVPRGWTPAPPGPRGGRHPKGAQIASALGAAGELVGSPEYRADFGPYAPTAEEIAFLVTNAARWRAAWLAAKQAVKYASEQRTAWERDALARMDALKPMFDYVVSRDASAAAQYSATAKYMGEAAAIAARAASSRKARTRARGSAKAGAGAETAGSEPTDPPPLSLRRTRTSS